MWPRLRGVSFTPWFRQNNEPDWSPEGKTPAEIAQYYSDREATILENARRMVTEARESAPGNPAPPPPTPPGNPEFITREQFSQMTATAQKGLIQMAQMTASTGKSDWNRLLPDVKKIVEAMGPDLQINSEVWEEAYYNVRGRHTDTLLSEQRNRDLGLEPPTPPPPTPERPREWTPEENRVIEGLNVTRTMYADAEKKLAENYQPFTIDNRRKA